MVAYHSQDQEPEALAPTVPRGTLQNSRGKAADGMGIGIRQRRDGTAAQELFAVSSLPRTVHGARGLEIHTTSARGETLKNDAARVRRAACAAPRISRRGRATRQNHVGSPRT